MSESCIPTFRQKTSQKARKRSVFRLFRHEASNKAGTPRVFRLFRLFRLFWTLMGSPGALLEMSARSWKCRNDSCSPTFRHETSQKPENLVYSGFSDMRHPTMSENLVYSDFPTFPTFLDTGGFSWVLLARSWKCRTRHGNPGEPTSVQKSRKSRKSRNTRGVPAFCDVSCRNSRNTRGFPASVMSPDGKPEYTSHSDISKRTQENPPVSRKVGKVGKVGIHEVFRLFVMSHVGRVGIHEVFRLL